METPPDDVATASTTGGRRRTAVALAAVAVAAVALGALVTWVALRDGDDAPSRQARVADRGSLVMPFDLDATTHAFDTTDRGGVQSVVADDPDDAEQVALIRSHLRTEADRFERGDFGDPAAIHGHDMPGLAVLQARAAVLEVSYREVDGGAAVEYSSDDPVVVDALHEWFAAQLADHGSHARTGH